MLSLNAGLERNAQEELQPRTALLAAVPGVCVTGRWSVVKETLVRLWCKKQQQKSDRIIFVSRSAGFSI